jgi:excisionase family DNA binding protein
MTPDTSRLRVSPIPRLALNLEQAGQSVDLCGKTIANLIRDGRLRSVRVGTRHLVPITELQCWLDAEAGLTAEGEA